MSDERPDLMFWKAVALAAALFYVYKVTKANGGTLSGNTMGINLNPDKIVDMAAHFVPKDFRHHARTAGKAIIQNYMNQGEIRNA